MNIYEKAKVRLKKEGRLIAQQPEKKDYAI